MDKSSKKEIMNTTEEKERSWWHSTKANNYRNHYTFTRNVLEFFLSFIRKGYY